MPSWVASKPRGLVEADRVRAALVRGQLDEAAAAPPCLADGPFDHPVAEAPAPVGAADADRLDLGALGAHAAEPGDEGQLQGAGDLAVDVGHDEVVAGVGLDVVEGGPVGVDVSLATGADRVVGEECDDRRYVVSGGAAEDHVGRHVPEL